MDMAPLADSGPGPEYACDLLLKAGHVIDGKNHIHDVRDVAVKDGKIAAVRLDIPASFGVQGR